MSEVETSGVSGILLAAGSGNRFGSGKLLAELGGRPLIEAPLSALRYALVDEMIVVVGARSERLRRLCQTYGARVIENPGWKRGQSTSVRAGLHACSPRARAAVVLLGDQPLVKRDAVDRLVAAFERGAKVAVATYGGRPRNPVLFSREVWTALAEELSGDVGAKPFLRDHPELVTEVPCDDLSDPADVDTRDDLRRLRERLRGRQGAYRVRDG